MECINKDVFTIIRSYLIKNYDFEVFSNVEDIINLGNKCGLSFILAYTLKKNNIYKDNGILDSTLFYGVARFEKQNLIRENIKEVLEKNGIGFLFLKGISLAKYYDEEYLRYSSDIDIIVEENNYEKAKDLLIKNSFKLVVYASNELTLSKSGVSIDLHCKYSKYEENIENMFEDVDYSNKNHELSNEHKYLFLIAHLSKHLREVYISTQFLIDLYYVNELDLDREYINNRLQKAKLDKLNIETLKVVDYLVNDNGNELTKKYCDFLFNVANNKGIENMVLVGSGNKNRVGYVISRVFPNYTEMIRMYPKLKDNKLLLPYYYVVRIIDRVNQGKGNQAINEFKVSSKVDKDKIEETKKLFEEIGL